MRNEKNGWIYEDNGEIWMPTRSAAKMLCTGLSGVHHLYKRGTIKHIKKIARNVTNFYLLSEIETLARDPARLRKIITHEDRQEGRKLGDPAKIDDTFLTTKGVKDVLGVTSAMLVWYLRHHALTCYQRVIGRSPHRFDPHEVELLTLKRARLKRIRADRKEFRAMDAERSKKTLPRPQKCDALTENDLRTRELIMEDWITARQAAVLLGVSVYTIYQIRERNRLYGERRLYNKGLRKQQQWFFRKADVLALRDDPEYRQGRAHYERHCSRLARQIKAERTIPASIKITVPEVGTPISRRLTKGGGDW